MGTIFVDKIKSGGGTNLITGQTSGTDNLIIGGNAGANIASGGNENVLMVINEEDKTLWGVGLNDYGELGQNNKTTYFTSTVEIEWD